MNEKEARQNMDKLVYVKAPGTKEGTQQVRIVDVDPGVTSPWGRGSVTVEFPHEPDRGRIKHALNQLELVENTGRRKRRVKRKRGMVS